MDNRAYLLWVCSNDISSSGIPGPSSVTGSFVKGFDLAPGEGKVSAALPGNATLCNDMAVGADGSLFVTNSLAPQILRLRPGSSQLEVWLEDPALEQPPKGAPGLDGIAFGGDGNLYVNNFASGAFFRVEVKDGAPGKITKLIPSRPLKNPDGLRWTGESSSWPRAAEASLVSSSTAIAWVSRQSRMVSRDQRRWPLPAKRCGPPRVSCPHLFQANTTGPPRLPFRIIGVPVPNHVDRDDGASE